LFLFRSISNLPHLKPINEVGATRFTGKTFTRRRTFPDSIDDYVAVIDRCEAGRIMKLQRAGNRLVWFWTLTGPYFPGPKSHDGEEETLEAALKAFKEKFWQWHEWALKQPGPITWHGADQ
jgi:hypothetical protein